VKHFEIRCRWQRMTGRARARFNGANDSLNQRCQNNPKIQRKETNQHPRMPTTMKCFIGLLSFAGSVSGFSLQWHNNNNNNNIATNVQPPESLSVSVGTTTTTTTTTAVVSRHTFFTTTLAVAVPMVWSPHVAAARGRATLEQAYDRYAVRIKTGGAFYQNDLKMLVATADWKGILNALQEPPARTKSDLQKADAGVAERGS
jgi:hypothetical protein